LIVEPQEGRAAAAREASGGTFDDPALVDKLLDDERNGAPLQSGEAREIGSGNGLPAADQAEQDYAIDVAGDVARGHLDIVEVDSPHGMSNVTIFASSSRENWWRRDARRRGRFVRRCEGSRSAGG